MGILREYDLPEYPLQRAIAEADPLRYRKCSFVADITDFVKNLEGISLKNKRAHFVHFCSDWNAEVMAKEHRVQGDVALISQALVNLVLAEDLAE